MHPFLVLYVNKNRAKTTRIGITCSKKVGNAVARNRARRVIRAAMHQVLPQTVGNVDLVFVARVQTAQKKSGDIAKAMASLLKKAGLQTLPNPGAAGQNMPKTNSGLNSKINTQKNTQIIPQKKNTENPGGQNPNGQPQ